jgi:flagellin
MVLSTLTGYTGSADKTFTVKVSSVSGVDGAVTGIQYSTDGGNSYSNSVAVTANAVSIEGVTLTFGAANNNANDQWTYSMNASSTTLQLFGGTEAAVGTQIGADVKVHGNVTSATLGDAATSRTLDVNFLYSNFNTVAEFTDFSLTVQNSSAATVGLNGSITTEADAKKGINVSTQQAANNAISVVNQAMTKVSDQRSALGAVQNRLEHTIANLSAAAENLTAAESRIRDVDMASEMASFTRSQVLLQAGTAMMAQANQKPQNVLQLLR